MGRKPVHALRSESAHSSVSTIIGLCVGMQHNVSIPWLGVKSSYPRSCKHAFEPRK